LSSLRANLKKNLGYKLLALGFAISLATSVYHQPVQEFVVEIGVNLTGLPSNKIFVGEAPATLVVRLQGPESELLDLARRSNDVRYEIELNKSENGQEIIFDPHRIEKLLRVHRVQVAGIRPRLLKVLMEHKLEREVPIEVKYSGVPREGFRHDQRNSQVLPSTVVVSGPESDVAKIHLVNTKSVPLDGLDQAAQFEQPLVRPNGSFVKLSPPQVRVEVAITEELRSQKMDALPVEIIGCPPSYTCTVNPKKVWLIAHGPYRAMGRLQSSPPTKVQVSVPPRSNTPVLRLDCFLPKHEQGVHVQFEPPSVEVRLEAKGKPEPTNPIETDPPSKPD
jgi:hypothetical protein